MVELICSAPHLVSASTRSDLLSWGVQPDAIEGVSQSSGRLLYKGPNNQPESGLWVCTPGRWRLSVPRDELCYFVAGEATYRHNNGETIEVTPATLVLFQAGWSGECTVHTALRNTYMLACEHADSPDGAPSMVTPLLRNPLSITDLVDWGLIPTMLEGASYTSGKLLHKGAGGRSECGIWRCTPGKWFCHVTGDEFCHFLTGRCTYVHESGEIIEIAPDTAAFFPENWRGVCTVHETVTKVYMIR